LIEFITDLDKKILLFINSMNTPFWDTAMLAFSKRFFWVPFYALLVYFIVARFKKRSILILISITLLIVCADQFTSALCKPLFERLRPCHDPSINYLLHSAEHCGGKYGFMSSHAANHFALAAFIWLLFRKEHKYVWLMFIWAGLVSYSRIYLGAHFPTDVIAGGISGVLFSLVFYRIYLLTEKKIFKKEL
jgi:undecaprenyl-diphosphatase